MTVGMKGLTDPKRNEGSASNSGSDEQSPEAFRDIPFDVKDHILSLIDSPKDLLALSLTSREWGTMILPLHIRYRELRIRANQPEIWQHLAIRTDLAKNIRKVCLMTPSDRRNQRLPLDKVHRIVKDTPTEHPQPEMVQALSHFESLTSFTWLGSDQHCQFTEGIFGALANCHRLVELILGDICPRKDHLNPESSIWTIRNLRILDLKGLDWVSLDDAEYSLVSMLNNSPALEELTIPYNCSSVKFTSCRFRSLIKLHISVQMSTIVREDLLITDNLIIDFLFAHPTIQNLSWHPKGKGPAFLPQGLLPTLKHLSTTHYLATVLLRDNTVIKSRTIETISSISLDLDTVRLLGTINGSRLQEIHLKNDGGIETIRKLAVLFPTIKTLVMPDLGDLRDRNVDKYIDCFGEFPLLEHLYDISVWRAIQFQIGDKRREIIKKLYTRCSALKTMSYLDYILVFCRDGPDVTWEWTMKEI